MSAETRLTATLLAHAPLTALVGAGAAARIYPDNVPQEQAAPCVAYSRTGTENTYSISGQIVAERATLEVWCMAEARAKAEEICDAASAACKGAGYLLAGRRGEFDPDAELWGAVLTVDIWTL